MNSVLPEGAVEFIGRLAWEAVSPVGGLGLLCRYIAPLRLGSVAVGLGVIVGVAVGVGVLDGVNV